MSNTAIFEPPGAASVSAYVAEYGKELDQRLQAVKAAERRTERAAEAPPGKVIFSVSELELTW
jgi:hypothetical protein